MPDLACCSVYLLTEETYHKTKSSTQDLVIFSRQSRSELYRKAASTFAEAAQGPPIDHGIRGPKAASVALDAERANGHTGVHLPPYFKLCPIALCWFATSRASLEPQRITSAPWVREGVKVGEPGIAETITDRHLLSNCRERERVVG
jgi:hypothetical protein